MTDEEIIERLCRENEEFKNLVGRHRDLDEKISELTKNKYLTPEEDLNKKNLQKKKLMKKDKIAEFVREYRKSYNN
ncbi:hypothetical protein MCHI_001732 [Candidatus Magnetoovum chiemensis]|nr:hypothetical protein MCHI_001732 [Candidatus Magnetoovum chiemensis]